MTHQYGRDWRIKISDGGSPATFSTIGGEGSWDKRVSSDQVDLSSKDDGAFKAMGWGQQSVTFQVQGKAKLPDTGLEKAYAVSTSDPPEIEIQLVNGASVVWQGNVGIGNFSLSGPSNGAVTYSFDMTAVEAPSIDDLTP